MGWDLFWILNKFKKSQVENLLKYLVYWVHTQDIELIAGIISDFRDRQNLNWDHRLGFGSSYSVYYYEVE